MSNQSGKTINGRLLSAPINIDEKASPRLRNSSVIDHSKFS